MFLKLTIIFSSLLIVIKCQTNSTRNDLLSINNKIAVDLLNIFPTNDNNFFSPLSITTALLMVMNGANGVTQQEFRQLFNLDENVNLNLLNEEVKSVLQNIKSKESEKLILKLANLLLVSNGFPILPEYQKVMTDMFGANIQSVDFKNNTKQVIKDINDWVSDQTNQKIKSVFDENDSLPEDTPMVLLNAIYFKGMWKYVFNRKDTQKQKFYNFGEYNNFALVDMMINERQLSIKYSKRLQANIFDMPFSDNTDMTMLVILPDELNGLNSITKKISFKSLNNTLQRMSRRKQSNERLIFPKFKLESSYDLKEYLKVLGLKTLFEDSADLSGIDGQRLLKVAKAVHKAHIDINEEGAEAAAVTKVIYATRSFRPNPAKVDRPFLFAIVDKKTSLIWFLGQIRKLSSV